MMRVSRAEAAKNRERVVQKASELFRANGYDGTGIASLMKAAGLTNGAFYKQFDSKEALIAEATARGLEENLETWRAVLGRADGDAQQAISDWYLSQAHVDHRDKGCTYAALASEAPRHGEEVRVAFDQAVRDTVTVLSEATEDAEEGTKLAIRHLSRLVGALILTRATSDDELAAEILDANR